MTSQLTDLRNLVSQKEKEWKDAVDRRLIQLEEDLASKTSLLEDRQTKLLRLKEDFKYNVQLLKDRDREISRLEAEIAEANQRAHAADLATSESAVALDEARAAIVSLRDDKVALVEEMDRQSAGHVSETERVRRELELQIERQRSAAADRERHLEVELVRLREEMEAQRREMLSTMEAALAAREAESREAAEQVSKRALASDLRAQLLERELEACREARSTAMREAAQGDERLRDAAAKAAAETLRLESEIALRDASLERLQEAVTAAEATKAAAEEAARRQAEQFERALSERQAAAKEVAELLAAERKEGRQKLAEACETFEAAQFEFGQVEWRLQEEAKQLQLRLEAAHEELAALRERAEAAERRAETSRGEQAAEVRALRLEASAKREEAAKCRQELAAMLERERKATQAAAQAELDAAAKTEEAVEAERERLDGLVTNLVAKTSELNAQLEAARETLAQKELLLQGLIHERDLALQSLQDHGLPFNRRAELRVPPELQNQLRQAQNENAQLRSELERARRKEEKKRAEEEESPAADPTVQLSNNPSTSRLRQERIQLIAQCRKQASRIQHLEGQIESLQNELRDNLTQIDKLEYEVSAGARHHGTELGAARQRIADLEGQLAESRREADEYYKGSLEQTRLNEELERRLVLAQSGKKTVKATPTLEFGAQELLIQQLQDEVESLQQRLRSELNEQAVSARDRGGGSDESSRLRAKLKLAAQKLMRLAEENAVLREASSHLRAALFKAGLPVPAAAKNRARYPRAPPPPTGGGDGSRLREVQGIEYALVRQRMAARTHSPPERLPSPASAPVPVAAPAAPPAPARKPPMQAKRPALTDSGDGSLAELWQQLGDCDISSSVSEHRTF